MKQCYTIAQIKEHDEMFRVLTKWSLRVNGNIEEVSKWHQKWINDGYTLLEVQNAIVMDDIRFNNAPLMIETDSFAFCEDNKREWYKYIREDLKKVRKEIEEGTK